ncbi:glycoside hydrolase family 5 protein [Ramlibacter ginsenosidimutans]|nr:cellulase family glycosylhydrolase [Ramlibacter ginsenosidimutans]
MQFAIGTNLASMELGDALRFGPSTLPNVNFAVPRQQDVDYLKANGFGKSRLPIRWEMLQPILHDAKPSAETLSKIGVSGPGEFHPGYAAFITQVLDAHAKAGTKCIIDVHNYCRYTDFVYQANGDVKGLTKPNSVAQAFTTDSSQVQFRIMALAPGATLTIDNYVDFMSRIAKKWKDHPGLGGYGMMNEPNAMPKPGDTLGNDPNLPPIYNGQDLTIWPTFAAAAVKAIRAIDADTLIYLGGNNFSDAWGLGTENPGWPLNAEKIVYEVHCYLDATNSGQGANWNIQVGSNFSVGVNDKAPIDEMTGAKRLQQALDFALPRKMAIALTETGMPADDAHWQASWTNMIQLAKKNNVEVYSWAGGSHWQHRGQHVTHIPTWYQNKPAQSQQAGAMMAVAESWKASIFDAGPGWARTDAGAPAPVTITVYARGALQQSVTITVSSDNGGTFNKTTLIIPAGANGSDSFTFTPKANAVTTLTYSSNSAPNLPPPRKVYSLTDPVAYSATTRADGTSNLPDAAMALLAKYAAAKWDMADGYTDPLYGAPCAVGQELRAVSDSGFGSSAGNEMEMVNWFNTGPGMGLFVTPKMAMVGTRKAADLTNADYRVQVFGLWCRKRFAVPLTSSTTFTADPTPIEVVPYGLNDPQFAIAAISVPSADASGVIFQASAADYGHLAALELKAGKPQARWVDPAGTETVVPALTALTPGTPTTVALLSTGSTQTLRVGAAATSKAVTLPSAQFDQLLLGSGFNYDFPQQSFGGYLVAAVTGKGTPTSAEMGVIESYLLLGTH